MKNTKRWIALLLSATMILNSNVVPVFATTTDNTAVEATTAAAEEVTTAAAEETTTAAAEEVTTAAAEEVTTAAAEETTTAAAEETTTAAEEAPTEEVAKLALTGMKEATIGEVTFDETTKEATLKVGTNTNQLKLTPIFPEGLNTEEVKVTYSYKDTEDGEQAPVYNATETATFTDIVAKNGIGAELTITITDGTVSEAYTLKIERVAVLSSAGFVKRMNESVQSGNLIAFKENITEYNVVLDGISYPELTIYGIDNNATNVLVEFTGEGIETSKRIEGATNFPYVGRATYKVPTTEEMFQKGCLSFTMKNVSYEELGLEAVEYKINVYPYAFKDVVYSNRTENTVDASFVADLDGKVYYTAMALDTNDNLISSSTAQTWPSVDVKKGEEVRVRIGNMDYAPMKVYLCYIDSITASVQQTQMVINEVSSYEPLVLKKGEESIRVDFATGKATYTAETYGVSGDFTFVPEVPLCISEKKPDLEITYTYTDVEGQKQSVTGVIGNEISLPKVIEDGKHKGNTITCQYKVDGETYTYQLVIKRRAIVNELKVTDQNGKEIALQKDPEKAYDYAAVLDPDVTKVKVAAKGGDKILINGEEKPEGMYELDIDTAGEQPVVRIQVDSEAEEKPEYTIAFVQKLRPLSVTERDVLTAKLNYRLYADGDVYYMLKDAAEAAPAAETVKNEGTKIEGLTAGDHTLELSGLKGEAQKLYLVLASGDQVVTRLRTVDVEEVKLLAQVKITSGAQTYADYQTVDFGTNKEATVILPAYNAKNTKIVVYGQNGTKVVSGLTISYSYPNVSNAEQPINVAEHNHKTGTTKIDNFIYQNGTTGNDITIIAKKDGYTQTYIAHVIRESYPGTILVNEVNGNAVTLNPKLTFAASNPKTEASAVVMDDVVITATDILPSTNYDEEHKDQPVISFNGVKSADGTYTAEVKSATKPTVVKIKVENGAAVEREYTLSFTKEAGLVNFKPSVTPEDASFTLYDGEKCDNRIWPDESGVYQVKAGQQYTYMIAKEGYIGKTGPLFLTEDEERSFVLEKAADGAELNQLPADYPAFRNGEDNMAVVSSKTPVTNDTLELKWEKQIGGYTSATSGTSPIIVDDKIYTISSNTVYVLDKETGEELKKATLAGATGFGLMPPTYGDGMLFILLDGGRIQCINAETLESLWIYKDPMGGAAYSDIRYDDGYVYVGFYTSGKSTSFVCLSATDEDPTDTREDKVPIWRNTSLGTFYWNGAWSNENYVFVTASLVGGVQSGLYCLDKQTGKVMQQEIVPTVKCNISYYNGRIYFATTDGYLYSYNLTEDGMLDTENKIAPCWFGTSSSASTPVIYNNRIYVGATNGLNTICVLDIEPESGKVSYAYGIPAGTIQTSGLITKGYEDEDGYVYVYFLQNTGYGALYMVKDKAGLTEPDPASGRLYISNHPQYCIASAVADSDGNLYLKNDSAWQYVLKRAELYLEDVNVTGADAVFNDGIELYGSETEQYLTVAPDTKQLTLDFVANTKEASVYVNGKKGSRADITLTGDATVVPVRLEKGEMVREYTFTIYRGTVITDMYVQTDYDDNSPKPFSLTPSFDPSVMNYAAGYDTATTKAHIVMRTTNKYPNITCEVVNGVKDANPGDELSVHNMYHEEKRSIGAWVLVPFADDRNATTATVKITLSSTEDPADNKTYYVTLYTGDALPVVSSGEDAVKERTDNSAVIDIATNKKGTVYYMTQKAGEAAPDMAKLKEEGKTMEGAKGSHTLNLTELTRDEQVLYMMLVDSKGMTSLVTEINIPSTWILGDLNEDGRVTNADVTMLLDKITEGESVELGVGDLNNDGKITNADVSKLLDKVTDGTI